MTPNHEVGLYIFLLAGFLGYHVITRVPPLLHTPLMSATNAISGISLIGSLVVAGEMHDWLSTILGMIAVACSSTNVVGGFLITDRMLAMFRTSSKGGGQPLLQRLVLPLGLLALVLALGSIGYVVVVAKWDRADVLNLLNYVYILAGVLFILGLKGLSSPRYARQ